MRDTRDFARQIRIYALEMAYTAKAAHLASALSCADILAVLYNEILRIDPAKPRAEDRDRFILSKGHAATALYASLAIKGIIPYESLGNLWAARFPSGGTPSPNLLGVEAATGSLGHGLPIANGMALASLINEVDYRVFVLLSDGECNEGSVWEAAMFAPIQKLNNLTVIIDFNKWQATGRTRETLSLEPLVDKWRAFGWHVSEIDGHDLSSLKQALNNFNHRKPLAIIANTIKGKGVSFMEDDNNWHYAVPTEEQLIQAKTELGGLV